MVVLDVAMKSLKFINKMQGQKLEMPSEGTHTLF